MSADAAAVAPPPAEKAGPDAKAEGGGETEGKKDKDEKDKPLTPLWLSIYAAASLWGTVCLYFYVKAGFSLHRMEILMLEQFGRLPLYWPEGPQAAEMNSDPDNHGLPPDVMAAFMEWFIVSDLQQPEGLTRDDILELMGELGFEESDQACKNFLMRGPGHLEERRRLTGVGLEESLGLLAVLAIPEEARKDAEETADRAPIIGASLGADIVELLHKKTRTVTKVLSAADAALQQEGEARMQQALASSGDAPAGSFGVGLATCAGAPAGTLAEAEAVAEDQQLQLEIARLEKIEAGIMQRLERAGALTPAEEGRLRDARDALARLR